MNRKEFVRKVAETMRINNLRKPVKSPRSVFHISDDDGNTKDFVVRKSEKNVLYTVDDVENIIDTCLAVIEDTLMHGDYISIRGFGIFELRYRKGRRMKDNQGEWIDCPPMYVPKFTFGKNLKRSAKLYEVSENEKREYYSALRQSGDNDGAGG